MSISGWSPLTRSRVGSSAPTPTRSTSCVPAFSPDGRRLAYGRLGGPSVALAVADVDADGRTSDPVIIEVGDGLPPPCPLWSPDGSQIAFGVARTSPINTTTSAAGSEVWIVTLSDNSVTVLPDLLATDLEWSPDGSLLAIASGFDDVDPGGQQAPRRPDLPVLAGLGDDPVHRRHPRGHESDAGRPTAGVSPTTPETRLTNYGSSTSTPSSRTRLPHTMITTGLDLCGHPMASGSSTNDAWVLAVFRAMKWSCFR